MTVGFVRQLGAQSGVQLNPLQDNSEIPTQDNTDQIFGIAMRATRGRIDKPFVVDRGNVYKKLGYGEQMRVSALNEAWVHVVEALNNGAYQAVVQRLSVSGSSVISNIVAFMGSGAVLGAVTVAGGAVTAIAITSGGTGYGPNTKVTISGVGSGASATPTIANGVITGFTITGGTGYTVAPTVTVSNISFAVYTDVNLSALTTPFMFALKHLECHNDGIQINFRAEELRSNGVDVANSTITLDLLDSTGIKLYEFVGSLLSTAVDDYGNPTYLPDIVAAQTDAVTVTVGTVTAIPVTSSAYGYNSITGLPNWAQSGVQVAFTEGGTAYSVQDYQAAANALQYSPFNFGYLSSGGSQSAGLLAQLAQLAFNANIQLRFDITGSDTVSAAITFVEQLNYGASLTAHLLHGFWSPLKSNDPTGINGKGYFGVATLNIAYACGRNAITDANGFAPKNYPVAGRQWPINRTGMVQTYTPTQQELDSLARAKINPCLYDTFTGGGRYVFRDSLTSALVVSSLKKLIAVTDMSVSIDKAVVDFAKDVLQLPMDVAVKRMGDYLKYLFEGAQSAGWIVVSTDPFMKGKAFQYTVTPNAVNPYDRMDVNYWLRYDGTVRQIFVTQIYSR